MKNKRKHVMGVGGFCICVKCENRIPHERGIPCQDTHCPLCGGKMLREGSEHHQLFEKKKAEKKQTSQ